MHASKLTCEYAPKPIDLHSVGHHRPHPNIELSIVYQIRLFFIDYIKIIYEYPRISE